MSQPFNITATPAAKWVQEAMAAPDLQWLVKGLVPAQAITVIAGRPKKGKKSFLAQLIAMVVASGVGKCGIEPGGPAVPVLYIDREGVLKPTAQRYLALAKGTGVPITDNLHIAFNVPFKMDNPHSVADVRRLVAELGIKLVVIDTLAKSMSGDENSAKDMGLALLCAEAIKYDGCAVVLVHHLNKAKPLPGEQLDPALGMRGSSALEGAYDEVLSMQEATVDGERNLYLIRGGKFQAFEATPIVWDMECDAEGNLVSAAPTIGEFGEIPTVDADLLSKKPKFNGERP